ALQETFLMAFRGMEGFSGQARLETWLHRIAVNAALMRIRSRARRPEDSIEDLLPQFDETGHQRNATRWRPAIEESERAEVCSLVRQAIDTLPESYRTVLLLRDIDDLGTEEAASVLGITPNAVK